MATLAVAGQTGAPSVATVREAPLSLRDPRVGCLLDGRDESAKIIAALGLLPSDGGEIHQPVGRLGLGSEVAFPANVTWTGENIGSAIIQPAPGYTGRLISTGKYNQISNVHFHGMRTSNVLLTVRGPRSTFHHLHLSNSGSHGMEFVGTDENASAHANKITDINIEDCLGVGIFVNAVAYDNEFLNVWVGECRTGVRLHDGACFFDNLHVWGCVGNGVELGDSAHRNIFQNIYVESNGTGGAGSGVVLWQVWGNQFVGGRLWRNASNGIELYSSGRTRIMGLDIHDNGENGIRGRDSAMCQVIGNQFYDDTTPRRQDRPIVTVGTSNNWIVSNNVMRAYDHASGGMSLAGGNNVVSGNIE
ncbi:parallel beta-helix repeat (two copies) [Micromonospora chokoriensis]|uniref:Parallel beta-helix repeat (Two copies) n=1 Tax=Micromonospora chokoriensis TaxID=356851 RepID=A0A1C4Y3F5_9ACTN|nr:parallel beta-helix repeat (two copies) [Micromonospora chokoriensis]